MVPASLSPELAALVSPLIGYTGLSYWKCPQRPRRSHRHTSPARRQSCSDLIPDIMMTGLCQPSAARFLFSLAQFRSPGSASVHRQQGPPVLPEVTTVCFVLLCPPTQRGVYEDTTRTHQDRHSNCSTVINVPVTEIDQVENRTHRKKCETFESLIRFKQTKKKSQIQTKFLNVYLGPFLLKE